MGKTITHLIVGLGKGGAETMLYQVLKYRSDPDLRYRVISLGASHFYEDAIHQLECELLELNLRRRPIWTFWKLCRALRGTDTLCCWMYHANFLGYLAARLTGVKRVIWCIRHSTLEPQHNKKLTLILARFCARWSGKVSAISYNGERSRSVHEAIGYCPDVGKVVDNGCNCEIYRPDLSAEGRLHRELGIPEKKQIILAVTRDVPGKDVPNFIHAFAILRNSKQNVAAVLCGRDIESKNQTLVKLCEQENLVIGRDIYLLGVRNDVPYLLAACDLYVLHSASEAFPNALIQAMACGCLCVSTDTGDARRILDKPEWIVPTENPEALAEKMAQALVLLQEESEQVRRENCERVRQNYDIHQIVKQYEAMYEEPCMQNQAFLSGKKHG